MLAVVLLTFFAGCEQIDTLRQSEHAQQALETANQTVDQAKEQANHLADQAKKEVKQQYENLKNDTKTAVKDSVNQKIDETFDRF